MFNTYARNAYTHMFPVEMILGSTRCSFGLAPGCLVNHVHDFISIGLIVAMCDETVTVMWSKAPRRPFA